MKLVWHAFYIYACAWLCCIERAAVSELPWPSVSYGASPQLFDRMSAHLYQSAPAELLGKIACDVARAMPFFSRSLALYLYFSKGIHWNLETDELLFIRYKYIGKIRTFLSANRDETEWKR